MSCKKLLRILQFKSKIYINTNYKKYFVNKAIKSKKTTYIMNISYLLISDQGI